MRKLLCFILLLSATLTCAQVTVTVSPSSITGQPTLAVSLKGTATSSASIVSWSWNYGDGFTCISPNYCGMSVTHYYSKLGQYNVLFSATDANGKSASASMVVTVIAKVIDTVSSSISVFDKATVSIGSPILFVVNASSSNGVLQSITIDCGNGNVFTQTLFTQPPTGDLTITGVSSVTGTGQVCIYAIPGTFTGKVTIVDSLGQTSISSAQVVVNSH